jgi:hypothetical protein
VELLPDDDDGVEQVVVGLARAEDLDRFRASLPPEDRMLFDALLTDPRPRVVARRLGVAHTTVPRRVARLAERARDLGSRPGCERYAFSPFPV